MILRLFFLIILTILIWTSELAQYNHAQFIEFSHKLDYVDEIEEREEINKKIKFYRNSDFQRIKSKISI
jgi:hypothetical protein